MNRSRHTEQAFRPELLPQEEFLDLQKYARLLWLHKTTILIVAILCAALAAAIVYLIPKRFEATATLSFESDRANLTEIREVVDDAPDSRDHLQTQVEIIKSRKLINRVISRINLNSETFNPEPTLLSGLFSENSDTSTSEVGISPENNSDAIVQVPDKILETQPSQLAIDNTAILQEKNTVESEKKTNGETPVDPRITNRVLSDLRVELVRGTQLIRITYQSYSPELSALVANTLAEEYLASLSETRQAVTAKAADWLSERLDSLRINLESSERALSEYQSTNNLVDIDGVRGLVAQELNDVTDQLLAAKRTLQRATTDYKLVQRKQGDVTALVILPQVQNHPAIQGIRQQQASITRQISDLQLRYGPKHPRMIAAQNELQQLDTRLLSEIDEVAMVVVGEYESARERVTGLENELERVKAEFQAISQQEIDNEELKRQVEINRELYDTFLTRARETSQGTGYEKTNAQLSDPAMPPAKPLDDKARLIIAGAALLGILLASCAVFLIELLQDNIRNPDDVELQLNQKMFGLIPQIRNSNPQDRVKARSYFDGKQYQFSEAIKTLRTSLVLSNLDNPAKIVMVTSSVPGEGKTTVSASLAFALAQNERVLLIDADLRRPAIGQEFGVPTSRPGLTSLISGSHSEKECIVRDKSSGLFVLTSGPIPPDAQQILNSLRFSNTVKLLAKHYDRIIIDTAPVNAVSDALMISRLANATLYVVKSGATRKKIIQRGINRLNQVGITIDGIVLNQVDIESKSARSEEFYGYYGGQYGYGQDVSPVANLPERRQSEALEIA